MKYFEKNPGTPENCWETETNGEKKLQCAASEKLENSVSYFSLHRFQKDPSSEWD